MSENLKFSKNNDYLLVSILDDVITIQRAQEILSRIGDECSNLNCKKVLLDERSVERREITSQGIMKLSIEMAKQGLNKIHMAFWCQPHLIDEDSKLLSLFTFKNEFVVQHFSEEDRAIAWLKGQYSS